MCIYKQDHHREEVGGRDGVIFGYFFIIFSYCICEFVPQCVCVKLRGQLVGVKPSFYHVGPGYGTEATWHKSLSCSRLCPGTWHIPSEGLQNYPYLVNTIPGQTEVNHEGLDISSVAEYLASMFGALVPSLAHTNLLA